MVEMATAPRTVVSFLSGSTAMYWVPIGLFATTGASVANASGRATRPKARVKARMVGVLRSFGSDEDEDVVK